MTGGRINHFNITKQSKARDTSCLTACPAHASCKKSRCCLVPVRRPPGFEKQLLRPARDVRRHCHNLPALLRCAADAAWLCQDYDLDGNYARTWVPELARVPQKRVHEPWLMSRAEQEQAGCRIPVRGPPPSLCELRQRAALFA